MPVNNPNLILSSRHDSTIYVFIRRQLTLFVRNRHHAIRQVSILEHKSVWPPRNGGVKLVYDYSLLSILI